MKLSSLSLAIALAVGTPIANASTSPSWIDWTSATAGTLQIGSTTVGVTLSGSSPLGMVDGTGYYAGYPLTYGGLNPSDLIQVDAASDFILTFSQAIKDPLVSLVSVGQAGSPVTYTFNGPISVVSSGPNQWGYTGYTAGLNSLTGYEYNGILQLSGDYKTLTVSTAPAEFWHGFNVGSTAVAAVPEPETYAMLLTGLGLMGAIARRRKDKNA